MAGRRNVKKKVVSVLMAAALGATLLAGCGNSKTDAAGEGKGTDDKVTIRILTRIAGTSKQTQIYNEILDEFKAAHPEAMSFS